MSHLSGIGCSSCCPTIPQSSEYPTMLLAYSAHSGLSNYVYDLCSTLVAGHSRARGCKDMLKAPHRLLCYLCADDPAAEGGGRGKTISGTLWMASYSSRLLMPLLGSCAQLMRLLTSGATSLTSLTQWQA